MYYAGMLNDSESFYPTVISHRLQVRLGLARSGDKPKTLRGARPSNRFPSKTMHCTSSPSQDRTTVPTSSIHTSATLRRITQLAVWTPSAAFKARVPSTILCPRRILVMLWLLARLQLRIGVEFKFLPSLPGVPSWSYVLS